MRLEMNFIFLIFVFIFIKYNQCMYLFGESECAMLINEINTGTPESMRKSDFIELKMICDQDRPKTTSLQGFKLIGISTDTTSTTQKMSIDLVVNLQV